MRYNSRQTSFAAGELSKKFRNRSDLQQYKNACEELINFYPSASGTKYRGGTISIDDNADPFGVGFDTKSTYFPYLDANGDERLLAISVAVAATYGAKFTFTTNEITSEGPPIEKSLDYLETTAVYYILSQQAGGGYTNVRTAFPFSDVDLSEVNRCQIGSSVILTQKNGKLPPYILYPESLNDLTKLSMGHWLNRYSGNHPLYANRDMALSMPYGKANTNVNLCFYFGSTSTAKLRTTTETRVMYVVDSAGDAVTDFFNENFTGAFFRITDTAKQIECVVQCLDAASGTNAIPVSVYVGYPDAMAVVGGRSSNWRKGYWDKISGFPRTVTWYNQRLIFGGNKEEPDMIWCSAVDRPFQFMSDRLKQDATSDGSDLEWFGSLTDDMPFQVRIGSNQINRINTLVSAQALFIGTENGEFYASPIDAYFTAKNINVTKASTIGCSDVTPITLDDSIIFVDKTKRKLIRYYLSNELAFVDLTLFADDLFRKTYEGVTIYTDFQNRLLDRLAYVELYNRLYVLNSSGDIFCVNLTGKDSAAWNRIYLGGDAVYSDAFALPTSPKVIYFSEFFSSLLLSVNRFIAGGASNTFEKIELDFEHTLIENSSRDIKDKPIYLDCAQVVSAELCYKNFEVESVDGTNHVLKIEKAKTIYIGFPVTFFTDFSLYSLPTGLTQGTVYYLRNYPTTGVYGNSDFTVHASYADAAGNTNPIDIGAFTGEDLVVVSQLAAEETTNGTESLITQWAGAATIGGETVDALIDGEVTEVFIPASGLVQHSGFREAIFGFGYEGKLKSFPIEGGVYGESSRGSITRVDRLTLSFYKTFAGKFGASDYGLETIPFDGIEYSGDKTVDFPTSPDRDVQIVVKQEQPLPMTLLGYNVRGVTNEG